MRRFMQCYRLTAGKLEAVSDPVQKDDRADFDEELRAAGYTKQISSHLDNGGAAITVYASSEEGLPAYYIEVFGTEHSLAYLVADDFPGLLATLKELSPLIALVGLDQQSWVEAGREVWRDDQKRLPARR